MNARVDEIQSLVSSISDPEIKRKYNKALDYLQDDSGKQLQLTESQFTEVADLVMSTSNSRHFSNNDLAAIQVAGFVSLDAAIRESQANTIKAFNAGMSQISSEIKAVGTFVGACHEDTMKRLAQIESELDQLNKNVGVVGDTVGKVLQMTASLQNDFAEYVRQDKLATSKQLAHTQAIRLQQELESKYGHNKVLRNTAVGMLQAASLAAVRAETIITKAESLCLQTPNYWLAPALVTLSYWVAGSSVSIDDKAARQAIVNTLNESFARNRQKTALFFGLLCCRRRLFPDANKWFSLYIGFQSPYAVDHTFIVLLNLIASGVMGQGAEVSQMTSRITSWFHALASDEDGTYDRNLLNDWKSTISLEAAKLEDKRSKRYPALQAFSPTWPKLEACMDGALIHEGIANFLTTELAMKDFAQSNDEAIDGMLASLVSEFDAEELPIRREQEYQQLIIDFDGDESIAHKLRAIKDNVLSETKSIVSVISDAAREKSLSNASAATHVMAIKMQMGWVKKAHEELTEEYRKNEPNEITLQIGEFMATTNDGSNEAQVVNDFCNYVTDKERKSIEAALPTSGQKFCFVGGLIAAAVSLVVMIVCVLIQNIGTAMLMALLFIIGLIMFAVGVSSRNASKREVDAIREEMEKTRTYGVLVIRKFMAEAAEWRGDYAMRTSGKQFADDLIMDAARNVVSAEVCVSR